MKNKSILFIFFFICKISMHSQEINYNFRNTDLPFEERVEILINQMTLEEKVTQLVDRANAVPRLDIPTYNWWNEGLHGVARAGIATVFPQAIGLAATFDDSLVYNIATVVSDEFRAKYNDAISKGNRNRYFGLTVWSPNINIFRDPRWGRGQETFGEDPYLTSRMGIMYVKGLQGNHPKYFKTIATPKHYVVHSGPEKLRHVFNATTSEYDFLDTYTPAFEACIKEGNAYSIMGAYNRFRGHSCSASDTLLNTLLRNIWGFKGYVVSDCDAIADIYQTHKLVSSPEEAAALGIKNGCDLNCGNTYLHLTKAVERGLITEEDINRSLRRLMLARMKLGMFEPKGLVPYDTFTMANVDNKKNRDLALLSAQKSIVLLKNENKTLPLNRKLIKKIAVVGPNAQKREVMFGNYNGIPSYSVTPYEGIAKTVFQKTTVVYHPLNGLVTKYPESVHISNSFLKYNGKNGLKIEIYNNTQLEGSPIYTSIDTVLSYFWSGTSPFPNVPANNISIRWSGKLILPEEGTYSLSFTGDDGYRVYIDGKMVTEQWKFQSATTTTFQVTTKKGQEHDLIIEYFQAEHDAAVQLNWNPYTDKDIENTLKILEECDVIVYVGGLSPMLEGEEMPVNLPGFDGGDRTQIELPEVQTQMLKRLKKLGKPIVLVLMTGSALAINWESKNIDAILVSWYPGQEGGNAISSVLFGDYNPAGRLPVTFYASTSQLPPFEDYSMQNRTYRYFKDIPLYPFGYGISYTNFTYTNLKIPSTADTKDKIKVSVTVTNTGGRAGEEVVQLYIKHPVADTPVPIHALKRFKRVFLKAGDKTNLTFELESKDLAILNSKFQWMVKPGDIDIFVGGLQPSPILIKEKKVLMGTITLTGNEYVIKE